MHDTSYDTPIVTSLRGGTSSRLAADIPPSYQINYTSRKLETKAEAMDKKISQGKSLFVLRYTWASSRAGPGRAGPRQSLKQKMVAHARPGPTVGPKKVCPGPARVSCFLSGRRAFGPGLPKILWICYSDPAWVSSRAVFLLPRPAHRAKKCGLDPRFSGRAGLVGPGFPCPGLCSVSDECVGIRSACPHCVLYIRTITN
jgi:hypothetical protein